MEQLQFWLLGTFQVWQGNIRLDRSALGHRGLSLLALLLTRRNRYVSSESIIEHIWPHLDPTAAANDLRVAVLKLRQWLEPDLRRGPASRYLLTEPGGYRLSTESCFIDVDEFLSAFQQGQAARRAENLPVARWAFERARGLYRGEYLSEWPYAEWALVPREQLLAVHLQVLESYAQVCQRLRIYQEALSACQQILTIDPLRESAVRQLMLCHAERGEQTEALAAYADYRERLMAELGVEPAPETQALRARIAGRESAHEPALAPPANLPAVLLPLVGRGEALEALSGAWRQRPGVVMLAGEAGLGKTRLLDEWASTVEGPAFWYRAREGDSPFSAVLHLLGEYLDTGPPAATLQRLGPLGAPLAERLRVLRRLWPGCPEYSPLEAGAEQERLYHALLAALVLAAKDSSLFIVDDAQWVDGESLAVLGAVFRRLPAGGLFVLAYRSEEVASSEMLARWFAEQHRLKHVRQVVLSPLSSPDVLEVVRSVTGLPDPLMFAQRIHSVTAGNPLFLTEVLRGLTDEGRIYRDADGVWSVEGAAQGEGLGQLPFTNTLREAVLTRANRLTALQREVLYVAAVLRHLFTERTAEAVLEADMEQTRSAFRTLAERRLLVPREDQGGWEFSHYLVGEIVYESISDSHRRLLHRLCGQALAETAGQDAGEVAAEVVRHLRLGEGRADSLVKWAVLAGRWAYQRFACSQALEYFELAVKRLDLLPESQRDMRAALDAWEGLALVRQQLGEPRAALETLESTLPLATTSRDQARLLLRMARICERDTGEYDRALALVDQAEALLAEAEVADSEGMAEGHSTRAWVHYWRGDYEAGVRSARSGLSVAGNTSTALRALQALATNLHRMGQMEETIGIYRQILQTHEDSGDLNELVQAYNSLGNGLQVIGMLHETLDAYQKSAYLAEQLGDRRRLGVALSNYGITLEKIGSLPRSEAALRRAIELAQTVDAPYTVALARHHLGKTLTLKGRWREAQVELEAGMAQAAAIGARVLEAQARVHYGQWYWMQVRAEEAECEARVSLSVGEQLKDNFCRRESRLVLGEIALGEGSIAAAETLAREALDVAAWGSQRLAEGKAERLLGRIAAARGDRAEAQRRLAQSEHIFRECGALIELGITLMVRSECDRSADLDKRREWLLEARRLLRRARALPFLKQAEERLKLL